MSSEESTSWTRIPMKADYWDLDNPLRMYFDDDSSAFSMMRVPSDSQMKAVFPTDVDDRGIIGKTKSAKNYPLKSEENSSKPLPNSGCLKKAKQTPLNTF